MKRATKGVQQRAKGRAEAVRERDARGRAQHNDVRGRHTEARVHRSSAVLHADAVAAAETLIELDQDLEGAQLDD